MIIHFHRHFQKQFSKLPKSIQIKTREVIDIFVGNPLEPKLRNHPLAGQLIGKRAFSVTGDIRIVFEETDHYTVVLFLKIGGHAQVYE